jgi:two-component system sensor kinase FixL
MLYISEGLRFVSSHSRDDFISGSVQWGDLVHPDDKQQLEHDVQQALQRRGHYNFLYRINDPVRGTRWISEAGQGVYTPGGQVESLVGLLIDVTEHQKVQVRLREAQAELIHLSRNSAMTAMAATLAHELNQPLTAASNYLAGAQRMVADGGKRGIVDQGLKEAAQSLNRAGEIIRRLRKTSARGWEAQTELFNIHEAVREAVKLVSAAGYDDAEISFPAGDIQVVGDRVQIEQVLVNLIKNAVEAIRGRERREVTVTVSEKDGAAIAAVEDTGPGVSPEAARDLFGTFASEKEHGMGIGLSISRTIIESHKGRIWLEAAPGGGARFCFTLPTGAQHDRA